MSAWKLKLNRFKLWLRALHCNDRLIHHQKLGLPKFFRCLLGMSNLWRFFSKVIRFINLFNLGEKLVKFILDVVLIKQIHGSFLALNFPFDWLPKCFIFFYLVIMGNLIHITFESLFKSPTGWRTKLRYKVFCRIFRRRVIVVDKSLVVNFTML